MCEFLFWKINRKLPEIAKIFYGRKKMNVAILFGGKSGEHEVSLISASSVVRNIDSKKFKIVPIGISKKGVWFLQSEEELNRVRSDEKNSFKIIEDEKNLVSVIPGRGKNSFCVEGKSLEIDAVFPCVHGTNCEDGILQGLLEAADIPYVGCSVAASALTMDKERTKQVWQNAGLPIVPYVCVRRADLNDGAAFKKIVDDAIAKFGFPLFVKPCNAGSSVGAAKATNADELSAALDEAFLWDNKVLIEKSIDAREIECSVTGNAIIQNEKSQCGKVAAYVPGEILPKHDFYDYDAKYIDPDGAILKIPAMLENAQIEKIRTLAQEAYKILDCAGLSRVDFFIDKNSGELFLNEINVIPGFTSISMFSKMCEAGGLKYGQLITLLIEEALEVFEQKQTLLTSR